MSTVKISELPTLVNLDANTANSLFMGVDKTTGVTGKFTAHTLAQGLFSNEILNVGNNQITLPNTVAQFAAAGESYIQTNLVNTDDGGTADIVVTANTGTDSTFFMDMGLANKDFTPGFEFNNLGTAIYPLDGYLYMQGKEGELGGNLTVGTTTTNTEIKFIAGGHDNANVVAKIKHTGFYLVNGHGITFNDGSVQNYSATFAESFANGAFAKANSAGSFANGAFVSANASYDSQNTTASFANGAFARANSGYGQANSGASFANGAFVAANSGATFANASFLRANASYTAQNTTASFANASYDTANSAANFANGAFVAANTALDTGSAAFVHANSAYDNANSSLQNTSSIVVNTDLTVPGNLTVSGALRSSNTLIVPTIYGTNQTAITLSFSNSGLVRANIAADLVITPSLFVPGKIVHLIITNTSGQQRAITHGCTGLNSSLGATSFNLGATRTAHLEYFSFAGDLANTYVTATYQ